MVNRAGKSVTGILMVTQPQTIRKRSMYPSPLLRVRPSGSIMLSVTQTLAPLQRGQIMRAFQRPSWSYLPTRPRAVSRWWSSTIVWMKRTRPLRSASPRMRTVRQQSTRTRPNFHHPIRIRSRIMMIPHMLATALLLQPSRKMMRAIPYGSILMIPMQMVSWIYQRKRSSSM